MATLQDVADAAGVSVNTASRILRGRNKETRPSAIAQAARVREAARTLGYTPNSHARAMRLKLAFHIGLVLSNEYAAPYEFPIAKGCHEVIQAAGFSLNLVGSSYGDFRPEGRGLPHPDLYAGMLVTHVDETCRAYLRERFAALVWVDALRAPQRCVYRDERGAGETCAREMRALGYRRFLYLGPPCDAPGQHPSFLERRRGVLDALHGKGLEVLEREVPYPPAAREAAAAQLDAWITPGTAVIVDGQGTAEWLAHATARRGRIPGRAYALATCAEGLDAWGKWPDLARVGFHRAEMGRAAARMLLTLLKNPGAETPSVIQTGPWLERATAHVSPDVRRRAGLPPR